MNEHYYSKTPTSELKPRIIHTRLRKQEFTFHTGSGVFSPDKIDLGSKLLLEKAELPQDATVLDLGCGYGVVGISIAKTRPDLHVMLTDVNARATMLAKKNAKENGVKVITKTGDGYQKIKNKTFDVILLNPPQAAGKKKCFELIAQAKEHLNEEGTLQIVARHQKGGKSFEEHMQKEFGNVRVVARQSGFRIYLSTLQLNQS